MTRLLSLLLGSAALCAPLFLTPVPAAASGPAAPYQEVAAARNNNTQARSGRRTRRDSAQAPRRNRQSAQRSSTRRARPTQG